jgi:hypothetical protein
MSEQNPSPPAKAHAALCEKHRLRYNPNVHDGCARCRRERGELIATPRHESASAGDGVVAKAGSLGRALSVALGLIIGFAMLLYLDDLRTWKKVQVLRESGRYIEGLTPEQHEQLERLQKLFAGPQPDEPDEDTED